MKRWMFYLWNFWPPFLGCGIAIESFSSDLMSINVKLKRRPWTRNLVGVQFGGSIFAMTDPFYMVLLATQLGRDYIVWDKSASIRYRKPGTTTLRAEFVLTPQDLTDIRARLETAEKFDWERSVLVKDTGGNVVAEVHKVVYIRKKNKTVPK